MLQKIKTYLLVLTLLCLCGCAEEGPYTLGKLECNVEVSSITPNTAAVTVSIPDSKDNLIGRDYCSIFLSDHPLSNSTNRDDLISTNNQYNTAFFSNLHPNTTYYVIIYPDIYFNGKNQSPNRYLYDTGYSFTTTAEGDYSNLGDVKADVLFAGADFTLFQVSFPDFITLYDIENVSISSADNVYENCKGNLGSSCIYCPNAFAEGEELSINLRAHYYYEGGPSTMLQAELNIKTIYNSDHTILQNPQSKTIFAGHDYSLVKIDYPEGVSFNSVDVSFYVGEGKLFPESYVSNPNYFFRNNYVLVNNKTINTSKDLYLRVWGWLKVSGFDVNKTINIDGKVLRGEDNQNLFQVSTEKFTDDLRLVINLAEGFEVNEKYSSPVLSISNGQNVYFSVDYNSYLSTNNKIVFTLSTSQTELLIHGENYNLCLDDVTFNYIPAGLYMDVGPIYNEYRISWTY